MAQALLYSKNYTISKKDLVKAGKLIEKIENTARSPKDDPNEDVIDDTSKKRVSSKERRKRNAKTDLEEGLMEDSSKKPPKERRKRRGRQRKKCNSKKQVKGAGHGEYELISDSDEDVESSEALSAEVECDGNTQEDSLTPTEMSSVSNMDADSFRVNDSVPVNFKNLFSIVFPKEIRRDNDDVHSYDAVNHVINTADDIRHQIMRKVLFRMNSGSAEGIGVEPSPSNCHGAFASSSLQSEQNRNEFHPADSELAGEISDTQLPASDRTLASSYEIITPDIIQDNGKIEEHSNSKLVNEISDSEISISHQSVADNTISTFDNVQCQENMNELSKKRLSRSHMLGDNSVHEHGSLLLELQEPSPSEQQSPWDHHNSVTCADCNDFVITQNNLRRRVSKAYIREAISKHSGQHFMLPEFQDSELFPNPCEQDSPESQSTGDQTMGSSDESDREEFEGQKMSDEMPVLENCGLASKPSSASNCSDDLASNCSNDLAFNCSEGFTSNCSDGLASNCLDGSASNSPDNLPSMLSQGLVSNCSDDGNVSEPSTSDQCCVSPETTLTSEDNQITCAHSGQQVPLSLKHHLLRDLSPTVLSKCWQNHILKTYFDYLSDISLKRSSLAVGEGGKKLEYKRDAKDVEYVEVIAELRDVDEGESNIPELEKESKDSKFVEGTKSVDDTGSTKYGKDSHDRIFIEDNERIEEVGEMIGNQPKETHFESGPYSPISEPENSDSEPPPQCPSGYFYMSPLTLQLGLPVVALKPQPSLPVRASVPAAKELNQVECQPRKKYPIPENFRSLFLTYQRVKSKYFTKSHRVHPYRANDFVARNKLDVNHSALCVRGLSKETRSFHLSALFSTLGGRVLNVVICTDPKSPGTEIFAYITMSSDEEASDCVTYLQDMELHGNNLSIQKTELRFTPGLQSQFSGSGAILNVYEKINVKSAS